MAHGTEYSSFGCSEQKRNEDANDRLAEIAKANRKTSAQTENSSSHLPVRPEDPILLFKIALREQVPVSLIMVGCKSMSG